MRKKRTVTQRIIIAATVGALLSLGALFSKHHWVFDLISHFRIQYVILLIPGIFIAIAAKKSIPLVIMSVALAVHIYTVTVAWLPQSMQRDLASTSEFTEITVLSSNLLVVNSEYDAQLDFIESINPDIIALQEYSFAWHDVVTARLTDYPHYAAIPSYDAFGIALYSKFPIISGGVELFSPSTPHVINATIDLGDRTVGVMSVHTLPPVSTAMYAVRNESMRLIAESAVAHTDALIIMGDFNATPWTSHFKDMLSAGQLRDARAGHGIQFTWPTKPLLFPLRIPIDHILVNSRVRASQFETEQVKGSDHRNVWGRLQIY